VHTCKQKGIVTHFQRKSTKNFCCCGLRQHCATQKTTFIIKLNLVLSEIKGEEIKYLGFLENFLKEKSPFLNRKRRSLKKYANFYRFREISS